MAAWAASQLQALGIAPASLNLVGHSWGAVVAGEIAKAFPGGVNDLIALDPALDATTGAAVIAVGLIEFNPALGSVVMVAGALLTDPTYNTENVKFADHSRHSWAFYSSYFGSARSSATASESFVVNTGAPTSFSAHGAIVDLFTRILDCNITAAKNHTAIDAVDAFFSLANLNSPGRTWTPNRFDSLGHQSNSYFDAVLDARYQNDHSDLPTRLSYLGPDGRTLITQSVPS